MPGYHVLKLAMALTYKFWNKLECSSLENVSSLVYWMQVEPEPKHISGGPLLGRLLGLKANIRLGRKGLSGTIKCSTNINK